MNFVLVYILDRYHTCQGDFFASEVAHFLSILKSAFDGGFKKTVKNSKSC